MTRGLDLSILRGVIRGDASADRIVPPQGFTARLTIFTAAAMALSPHPMARAEGLAVSLDCAQAGNGRCLATWHE